MNPSGMCHCGCGERAPIAQETRAKLGYKKGEPQRFIFGHQNRGRSLPSRRKGVKRKTGNTVHAGGGYITEHEPHHPRAGDNGYVYQHVLIAERTLGKLLPLKAVVHHINGVRDDNRPENLVVCEDQAYHMLIHRRERALDACGNANWMRCQICGEWDAPENMWIHATRAMAKHRLCAALRARQRNGPRDTSSLASPFRGVTRNKRRWSAGVQVDGKRHHLGTFDTQEEAARAYDEAAVRLHGHYAQLNFPDQTV